MPGVLSSLLTQSVSIPKPTLTEDNLPDQSGRVFIVTGGYVGVGYALTKILYGANGTVYVAGRSEDKATKAIEELKTSTPKSTGRLEYLKLDLADLSTLKASVDEYLSKESKLDVLVNNAGVMVPPSGSKTAQSYELQIGTNCMGPYLLTNLLRPILTKTATSAARGSVRVAWAGSVVVDLAAPKGGLTFEENENGRPKVLGRRGDYAQSKTGNYFLALEAARHWGNEAGVLHVSFNPGNLKTELMRHSPGFVSFLSQPLLYDAKFGAYTELYSGWSEDVKMEDAGVFIQPWGRKASVRDDIVEGGKEGGKAKAFYDWCEKETKAHI